MDGGAQEAFASLQEGALGHLLVAPTKKKKVVELLSTGHGGIMEMKALLASDQIRYGVFRVIADGRSRSIFLNFVGDDVGGMARGRASMGKNAVYNSFPGVIGELAATDADEITEEAIEGLVRKLTGAAEVEIHLAASAKDGCDDGAAEEGQDDADAGELPAGWEACQDEDGNTYYYNEETGTSQWEYP